MTIFALLLLNACGGGRAGEREAVRISLRQISNCSLKQSQKMPMLWELDFFPPLDRFNMVPNLTCIHNSLTLDAPCVGRIYISIH